MTKWIAILTLFFVVDLQAQTKTLYFQIDTLKYTDQVETILNFRLTVGKQGFLNMGDNFDTTKTLTFKNFPNYSNALKLNSDSSTIEIPIDLNGSYITLKNAYFQSPDSLIIDHWQLYSTQPMDTTYTIIEYYKKINGQLDKKPYKLKKKFESSKAKSPPLTIQLRINGITHNVNLTLTKQQGIEITHGHGYKPRKYLDKNGEYKKRLTYFYVNSETIKYIWTGEIHLTKAK